MRRLARPIGLLSIAGGLALTAMLTLSPAANAATRVPVTFDCRGRPPVGSPQQLTLSTSIQADAPATAGAGATFDVTLAPDAMTVPTTAGGYAVNNLRTLVLRVAVPQGASVRSATLSGGSNLGSGTRPSPGAAR
jgi:dehydratase